MSLKYRLNRMYLMNQQHLKCLMNHLYLIRLMNHLNLKYLMNHYHHLRHLN